MAVMIMDPYYALGFRDVFNQIGWINLDFGTSPKRGMLAGLSPRIDFSTETVIICTPVHGRNMAMTSVEIDGHHIRDASFIATDRRFVCVSSKDNRIDEFYYGAINGWQRKPTLGDLPYVLTTNDGRKLLLKVRANGAGLFALGAALAGNPMAARDLVSGNQRVQSMMDLMDSFIRAVYVTSSGSVL